MRFITDEGEIFFEGFELNAPPAWLTPSRWDLLRVTARGMEVAEEDVRISFEPDKTVIYFR